MAKKQKNAMPAHTIRPAGIPPSLVWPPPRTVSGGVPHVWLRAYYQTDHWRGVSRQKRAGASQCEQCRQQPSAVVHHLHYYTLGHEGVGDLRAWCVRCHDLHHFLLRL